MFRTLTSLWGRMPLVGRLMLMASLALLVAATAMLYIVAREDVEQAQRDMEKSMATHLAVLPATVADWIVVGDYSVLQQAMDRYVGQENVVAVSFTSSTGATIVSHEQERPVRVPTWFAAWFDVAERLSSTSVDIGGRTYGRLEIRLSAQADAERAWDRLRRHLAILAFAIALDFFGIWLILRRTLSPLSTLHDATRKIKSGDLSVRLIPGGDPELQGVMATFNDMARTLEADRALLSRDRDYLEVTLSSIADGVITTGADGVVEFMNPVAETMTGWTAGEAHGRILPEVFVVREAGSEEALPCPIRQVLDENCVVTLGDNVQLVRRDDRAKHFIDMVAAPIRTSGAGAALGAVLVFRDESQKRVQEQRMSLLASVVEHASESVVITDPDTIIIDVNQAFTNVTGYQRDEAIGRKITILKSGYHDRGFYERMWAALTEDGYWHGEIHNRRKNGEIFVEMVSISAMRDAHGRVTHYFGLFTDITVLKEQQRQLEHLAYYDVLTGLPNRRLLADRFDVAQSQARRGKGSLAVCYLDLDGFKEVNDRLGHRTGDRLLVEVAERLKASVRAGDTVARLGGDEFVLVLMGFDRAADNEKILDRVLSNLTVPFSLDNLEVSVSASIGVALCPDESLIDLDSLLRRADHAMYIAKQAGRNRWHVFDVTQDRAVQEHHERREGIVRALKNEEFRLYYQPKVNMRTGELIGAEALIRWQHPERGLVSPAEFLPIIQDADLSIAVGEWVIGEALRQIEVWRQAGLRIPVSVNISAQHMQHPQFLNSLSRQMSQYPSLPQEMLEVEVLESSALDDLARASGVVRDCLRLGVTVALDDFGTGYSSLTYLRRLPVSTIKIDQTFVRDMLLNQDDIAIVEGVISLAKAFQRLVIAEGVETIEHGKVLLRMGCELGQGYGIARPMPGDAMAEWAATWKPDTAWTDIKLSPWPSEDLPLLYAGIAHRHWINQIISCIEGSSATLRIESSTLDDRSCAFGRWYAGPGALRYGDLTEFRVIEPLHQQVHALGEQLLLLLDSDPKAALARKDELLALRDILLDALERLSERLGI